MSDNILSLCYVSKRTDKYTQFCRIADLVDGDFIPYTYSGTDFYDTDLWTTNNVTSRAGVHRRI